MDYVIKSGDTPWNFAVKATGNGNNWPVFCKANPQLKADPKAGCLFYPGNTVHLPAGWEAIAGGTPTTAPSTTTTATATTAVPVPIGPPVEVVDTTAEPPVTAPAPAPSSSLLAGLDPTKVMIGGAAVAALVLVIYASRKKTKPAAA